MLNSIYARSDILYIKKNFHRKRAAFRSKEELSQ